MKSTRRWRPVGVVALVGVLAGLIVLWHGPPAMAQPDIDAAQELADKYAPVVMVKQQSEPCDTEGEQYEPTAIDIVLDNPEVLLRQVGNYDPVAERGPSAADIFDRREGWYLDFPGDTLNAGCVYEQDYQRFSADLPNVVYAHIVSEEGHPDQLALQYWFYWYFNDWNNDHESDWEFIQLLFDVGTVEEALQTEPVEVGFAQHEGGERADWDDGKLDKDGNRPVVFPSAGSHASYYGPALYLGRSGGEGFGCDITEGPSRRIDPEVILLPDEVTDPDDPLAWLAYKGRWGQRESGPFNGPTGPAEKPRWNEPVSWHDELRDSAVVIPGGDRLGTSVLNSFCSIVEFGSTVFATALRTPLVVALSLLVLASLAMWFIQRTTWSPVTPRPIRRHRAAGQIFRCALSIWTDRPRATLWIGIVYIPIVVVTGALQVGVQQIPFIRDLLELSGERGVVGGLLSVFVGGLGSLLAFVIVNAAVASLMDHPEGTDGGSGPDAYRAVAASGGALFSALLRATVIVMVLMVSVVGIPWGIRQLVRYQLLPQAVMLDGAGGQDALDRSSDLVRGQWFWTAAVVAFIQVLIGITSMVFALLILVLFTSIPLWLFSVFSSLVFVFMVPVAAAAMTYVYGELEIQHGSDEDDPAGQRVAASS